MGIALAWLAGEGIITYRWVKAGAPPTPGTLAMASGFFVLLALLGEYPPARTVATLTAVGVDIAALLQVIGKAPAKQATGWPPPLINDPGTLLPGGGSSSGNTGTSTTGTPAAKGGGSWNIWTGSL
jgi:hypothetical protein